MIEARSMSHVLFESEVIYVYRPYDLNFLISLRDIKALKQKTEEL